MDPFLIAPIATVGGGIGIRLMERHIRNKTIEAKGTYYEVTYYTSDGVLETKKMEAANVIDGEPFDENGCRIGYSAHYTRRLEIEISGIGRTKCDCIVCDAEEAAERHKEIARQKAIEEMETKRRQAEIARKKAEQREAAIARLEIEFNEGKYDHLSVRQMMQQGISKDKIVSRLGGPIVWPEYAVAGTTVVTYDREEVKTPAGHDEVEVDQIGVVSTIAHHNISYKYYRVDKTMYPTGETEFKRVEIDEEEYQKETVPPVTKFREADAATKMSMTRKELLDYLENNRRKNNMYIAQISEQKKKRTNSFEELMGIERDLEW